MRRAAKYKRISKDKEGRELGVTRQDEDLDALAERLGYVIVADYTDNDISASTRSRKRRPDYDQMLADARAGMFDVILAYTSGRLTRRVREHLDLIDLAVEHGVRFEYVKSPAFDLNSSAGRRIALTLAVQDQAEAEDIAERVSRAARQRAEAGQWHGGHVPFGYMLADGALVPHPEHAAWVRDAARRVLAGETLYGIAMDWNRLGRTTTWGKGGRWYPRAIKHILTTPTTAGLRRGYTTPAQWPALIDRDDFTRLCAILNTPGRSQSRGNARKYALSGLVYCAHPLPNGGVCGFRMHSINDYRGLGFRCYSISGGCGSMRIAMIPLERYIAEMVFYRADTPALRAAMAVDDDDPTVELRDAITRDQEALDRLADERDDGLIRDDAEYRRRRTRLVDRIADTEARLATVAPQRVHVPPGNELRHQWPVRDAVWKRTILSSVIERIEISSFPAGATTNLARRRGETDEDLAERRDAYTAHILSQRVRVVWRY